MTTWMGENGMGTQVLDARINHCVNGPKKDPLRLSLSAGNTFQFLSLRSLRSLAAKSYRLAQSRGFARQPGQFVLS